MQVHIVNITMPHEEDIVIAVREEASEEAIRNLVYATVYEVYEDSDMLEGVHFDYSVETVPILGM